MSIGVRFAITCVHAYRLLLAPWFGGACRFHPSCSEYAIEALRLHGVRRGSRLAIQRIARCQPLAQPGFDPVPPARQ